MTAAILYWASLGFGLAALIVYVGVLATQPRIARMVNGSGLFLKLAVAALCCAALAQSVVVLRNSRSWDGVDRRGTSSDRRRG
jgi:hypothetical protein